MGNYQDNPINVQFRKVYKYLEDNSIIKGKSDIAKNMGTYNHVINSILKGQRNITVDQLYSLISNYRVNPRYIFENKGPIILDDAEEVKKGITNYRIQKNQNLDDKDNMIFLAHASEDKKVVRKLYHDLKDYGLFPWLDEEDLEPGVKWDNKIREAIKNSRFFLACISSNSTKKDGYIQKELRVALSELERKSPENIQYLVPEKHNLVGVVGYQLTLIDSEGDSCILKFGNKEEFSAVAKEIDSDKILKPKLVLDKK